MPLPRGEVARECSPAGSKEQPEEIKEHNIAGGVARIRVTERVIAPCKGKYFYFFNASLLYFFAIRVIMYISIIKLQ